MKDRIDDIREFYDGYAEREKGRLERHERSIVASSRHMLYIGKKPEDTIL